MKVTYKVWLDQDGKAFGNGPSELLKRVEKTGSLHQAANQMGMSYSKAWCLIRTLEESLDPDIFNFGGSSKCPVLVKENFSLRWCCKQTCN
jgi:molybdate transport system regulatory protein